ncbi:CAAX amino protease [Streptomyces chrestomyceticus JCM 4735]|uniref:CAAX amino protease n=1 Tax=Streptomyces chrestomyceticus JCM 4735 TaxID=1306181 RepID=A0A7U9L1C9_9ACTN|nr:CPBP family intramembrane glutamic endopeptidase [Streptomyces chrestomyceticus]GCD38701.1 CAAX amino protease [Streptomyces chrestomyceticus JCM 4735]
MTRVAAGRESPLTFIALLAALSVPFWGAGAVFDLSGVLPMGMPPSAFQFVLPVAVASFLLFREEGGRGVRRLLRRTVSVRGAARPGCWALSVLLIPALFLVTYGLLSAAGAPPTGPHSPPASVPLLLVLYVVAAAAEEAGWTGYLLEPLRERWGTLGAGLVIGLVWASWHLVAYAQAGRSAAWTAGQVLGSVALRILMVRLYDSSGGIVLTVVVVHTAINVVESVFPGFTGHAAPALVLGAAASLTAALVTFLGPGPRAVHPLRARGEPIPVRPATEPMPADSAAEPVPSRPAAVTAVRRASPPPAGRTWPPDDR